MTNQYSYAEDFASKKPEANHKKTEASNISSAAKIYMMNRMQKETVADNYRSGNNNGQRYMTSEDFVTYFRSREGKPSNAVKPQVKSAPAQTPQKQMSSAKDQRPGEILRSASGSMPTRENVTRTQPRSNIAEAVRINKNNPVRVSASEDVKIYTPSAKAKKSFETRVFSVIDPKNVDRIKAVANDWLPKEEIIVAKRQKKDRSIKGMLLGIAGVALSLMLIVSGSVMLNEATRDVKKLENEVRALQKEEELLKLELDMKNDVNVLRDKAVGELGMIDKQYVEAFYLNTMGADGIESYESDKTKNVGFSTILSAFGRD